MPPQTTNEDRLKSVRQVIDRLVSDGRTVAQVDQTTHEIFPVAISPAEGEALRHWVTKESATRTIEIGLAYGVSALFIMEGLLMNGHENSQHVVTDPFQSAGFKNCGLQALKDAGVADLIEYHKEESQLLLPRFIREERRFDFAFVDGSHLFDNVFIDLIFLERLVQPMGIVFVDDFQLPSVAKAVSFCTTNLDWTIEEISAHDANHQWAVLRLPSEPVSRRFPHFVDF